MNARIMAVGVVVILAAPLCAQPNAAKVRVALIKTGPGQTADDVRALAEVELAKEESVELVERAEVERVLREQELLRSGLSDVRQAVALGRLLGVEVFAALDGFPDSETATGLVVFDAATGVILADTAAVGDSAKAMAASIKAAVLKACAKREQRAARRTVCLTAVRNADLPRELDSYCDGIARLLRSRLTDSPDIAVLERGRLEAINRERATPTGATTGDLIAALVLLELEISQTANPAEIRVSASLSDARGTTLGKVSVTGKRTDSVELAERLLSLLTGELTAAPVSAGTDRAAEALRFSCEAKFLVEHGDLARGLAAAEAACALDPANQAYQRTLATNLMQVAEGLLSAGSSDTPDDLKRSVRMVGRALDLQPVDAMDYMKQAAGLPDHFDEETRSLFVSLQERLRSELLSNNRTAVIKDFNQFQQHSYQLIYHVLPNLLYVSPTAQDWTSASIEVLSRWLDSAKSYRLYWDREEGPPYHSEGAAAINRLLAGPFARADLKDPVRLPAKPKWKLTAKEYARWNELYDLMLHHPVPAIQAYGAIGRLCVDARLAGLGTNSTQSRIEAIVQFVELKLNELPAEGSDSLRLLYYRTALDAIDALPTECISPEARWVKYSQLLASMLVRGELAVPVVSAATSNQVARIPGWELFGGAEFMPTNQASAVRQNTERVKALIQSSKGRWLGRNWKRLQDRILAHKSVEAPAPLAPWQEARLVFEVSEGWEQIERTLVHGNTAWLVVVGWKDGRRFLRLVVLDLPSGRVRALGEADHDWDGFANLGGIIPGICSGSGNIYVGTRHDGVFIFPERGGVPRHLATADGLPSDWVKSVTCLNGKLYLGLGEKEGFLAAYELKTGSCEVLASSRRKERRSLFDDSSPPFAVQGLHGDPARNRVIAMVSSPANRNEESLGGFWQLDATTEEFRRLSELPVVAQWWPADWLSPVHDNQFLLFQFPRTLVLFDLRTQARAHYAVTDCVAPFLRLGDWLWTGEPVLGRVSRDGQSREIFPPLPGEGPEMAFDMVALEPVAAGRQVLVAKKTKAWLLTLREKESKDSHP